MEITNANVFTPIEDYGGRSDLNIKTLIFKDSIHLSKAILLQCLLVIGSH